MFNSVTLIGRLTRDPEASETTGDHKTPVVRFVLAVDRDYQANGKTPTDFWPVKIYGEYGTKVARYLTRGRLVLVAGAAHLDSCKDDAGGYHNYAYIAASEIRFLAQRPEREPGEDDQ